MQPIPVKVKNVTVYAYFDPREPLSEVVIENGAGTYSVGTLGLSAFYNLDLTSGDRVNPLNVHGQYYAVGETEDGSSFTTPWMFCLDNGDNPTFGRTKRFVSTANETPEVAPVGDVESGYIKLSPLTNITVSQLFPPPAIGQRLLIEGGSGYIIATRTGTPHEMGVQVDTGKRYGPITPGSKLIMISGKTADGHQFSQTNLTVISGGEPAIFLRTFPS